MLKSLTAALALVLLLLTGGLSAQDKEATREEADAAIAEYEKYGKNSNEHVRRSAVDDLGNCNHPDVVPLLLAAMEDKSDTVRATVPSALVKQTTKGAYFQLTRELGKNKDLDTRLAILDTFKVNRPQVAYDKVLEFAEGKTFELRVVAAQLLGLLESENKKSEKALMELLKDSEPQVRIVAIDSLARLKYKDFHDLCLKTMREDKDWRVQSAAVAAIPALRLKESVIPLIDFLGEAEGRLADDVYHTLVELTGEDYPPKPERWKKWWDRLPPTWEPPSPAELDARREKLAKSMAAYGASDGGRPYHGIQTRSQRILFVLDVSYSMKQKVVIKDLSETEQKEFKERYGKPDGTFYDSKIEIAREELINYLATLPPYVSFNIILFNSEVKKWKPGLVKASGGSRSSAIKFLSRLDPEWLDSVTTQGKGSTNTFGAMNAVFGLKDEPQMKPTKNHKVDGDTVFFLTDGLPEVGEITDTDQLLEYFFRINNTMKICFHVITFGVSNRSFLKPMAEQTGGRYVEIAGGK
ncbi:MAG: HEAT repeat domain-containing protein [Planctomycetota bacterium]